MLEGTGMILAYSKPYNFTGLFGYSLYLLEVILGTSLLPLPLTEKWPITALKTRHTSLR
jgi:hypothetical protein